MEWFRQKQQEEVPCHLRIDTVVAPPRILITLAAYQKLFAYARACTTEVNGLGFVERVGNDFRITDVFILPQIVTPVSADLNDAAVHGLILDMVRAGRSPKELMLQWHSHGSMPAYCSPADHELISGYQCPAMISLVVNRQGEYHCRLDLYEPVRIGFEVEMHIVLPPIDEALMEQCRTEVAQQVSYPGVRGMFHRWFGGGRDPDESCPVLRGPLLFPLDEVLPGGVHDELQPPA
ncbi:hypothetical protein HY624_02070 [Candidatus Uhrbacteria bacterium]|nr:hypothetical protein [Candidatus Uhrbacteria bacterium]